MKRLLAFVASVLLVLSLTACDAIGGYSALIKKADKSLRRDGYSAEVEISFTTSYAELKEIFDGLSSRLTVVSKDGDLSVVSENGSGDTELVCKYILVNDELYYHISASNGTTQADVKARSPISDEEREELTSSLGVSLEIDPSDFSTVSVSKEKSTLISCSGISDEARTGIFNEYFERIASDEMELGYITMSVVINDGKYESETLRIPIIVKTEGGIRECVLTMTTTYSYENIAEIAAPSDAESYKNTTFDQIIGGKK